jgi:hypothetical protein
MTEHEEPKPKGLVERLRDASSRTLSEEFHSRSPNTQMHVKAITGGTTPTSGKIMRTTTLKHLDGTNTEVETDAETSEERFRIASDYEKEMMIQHGLIPPTCSAYREYMQNQKKTT